MAMTLSSATLFQCSLFITRKEWLPIQLMAAYSVRFGRSKKIRFGASLLLLLSIYTAHQDVDKSMNVCIISFSGTTYIHELWSSLATAQLHTKSNNKHVCILTVHSCYQFNGRSTTPVTQVSVTADVGLGCILKVTWPHSPATCVIGG